MRALAWLFVALLVPAVVLAQEDGDGESHSSIQINGRTIEVTGPGGASISNQDGRVVIRSGGQQITLDEKQIEAGGGTHDLPDYKVLKIKVGKDGVKIEVDGADLTDLLGIAAEFKAAGEAEPEAEAGKGKGAEDRFPVASVKSVKLAGLHEKFRVDVDPKASEVVVLRKGRAAVQAGVTVVLEGDGLVVEAKEPYGSQPKVIVVVPPGLALRVDGCREGKIGDLGGMLTLSMTGSDSISVGKVQGAAVKLMGSGDVEIAEVGGGDLELDIMGSGEIHVAGGTAAKGALTISGSGDISCLAVIAKASLRILGTGNITTVTPGEIVEKSILGTGDIEITK